MKKPMQNCIVLGRQKLVINNERNHKQRKKIPRRITWTLSRKRKTESYLVVHPTTQLISLKKDTNESMMDYVIRTETILTVPRNAGQIGDDALVITTILKGLPRHLEPFYVYVTHSDKLTFSEFKTELQASRKY